MVTHLYILNSEYLCLPKKKRRLCVCGYVWLGEGLYIITILKSTSIYFFYYQTFFSPLTSHMPKFSRAKPLDICSLFWPVVTFGKQNVPSVF